MTTITIPKKITQEVKTFIIHVVNEVLNDPDFSLGLSEKAKKRLRQASALKQKTISFAKIRGKYY